MVFVKAQLLLGWLDLRQNAVATLETTHSVANIKNRLPRLGWGDLLASVNFLTQATPLTSQLLFPLES